MKRLNFILIFTIGTIFILGCMPESEVKGEESIFDIHVSQQKGEDNGTGSIDNPFKSISKALQYYNSNKNIKKLNNISIGGGVYTKEKFPLILNKNIKLYRNDENNQTVIIKGSGNYDEYGRDVTIILNGGNKLNSLKISSSRGIGVLSRNGNNIIQSSVLEDNEFGLIVSNSSHIIVEDSTIVNNSNFGIGLFDTSSIYLKNDSIQKNGIGLNLNGTSYFSNISENTKITNNSNCDFYYKVDNDIYLTGITWDENIRNIEERDICEDGNDIVNSGIGKIFFDKPKALFENKDKIDIVMPIYGQKFNSSEDIKFKYNKNYKYIMMALWEKSPRVVLDTQDIKNPKKIIWYWNPSMSRENDLYIMYSEGKVPNNGNLNSINHDNESNPESLKKGDYYFSIWAWDNEGLKVVASSIILKFFIK